MSSAVENKPTLARTNYHVDQTTAGTAEEDLNVVKEDGSALVAQPIPKGRDLDWDNLTLVAGSGAGFTLFRLYKAEDGSTFKKRKTFGVAGGQTYQLNKDDLLGLVSDDAGATPKFKWTAETPGGAAFVSLSSEPREVAS